MSNATTTAPGTARVAEVIIDGIRHVKTYHPIEVREEEIKTSQYTKAGTVQATLRQRVETVSYYPTTSLSNNMSDNLFSVADFTGIQSDPRTTVENRVTWMTVPEGTTADQILARLQNYPEATIYRVLSNHPILTDKQTSALKAGLGSMETYAKAQLVKYGFQPDGNPIFDEATGEVKSGKPILDFRTQKLQYKVNHFSLTAKDDINLKNDVPGDMFISQDVMENHGAALVGGQQL